MSMWRFLRGCGWAENIQGETTKAPQGALLGADSAVAHLRPDTARERAESEGWAPALPEWTGLANTKHSLILGTWLRQSKTFP